MVITMLILSALDVRKALPMDMAVEAMKSAYTSLSGDQAVVPQRLRMEVAPHHGLSLFMPAYVQSPTGDALAVKVVSLFSDNPARGLSFIYAAVLVLSADTGKPAALLEGGALTAIRTGAASGAATDILARQDSKGLALFGSGVQGRTQLEAVCTVREIKTVWVYDVDANKANMLIQEMAGRGPVPKDLRLAHSPDEAVAEADVICTATTSLNPVFSDNHLKNGVHINGVGSYTPQMRELPEETVSRALVVVDSRTASLAEAGDLIQPIQSGRITESHIHAELGEILLGRREGRTSASQITLFKSVGVAVQDVAAAELALQNAHKHGLGQTVEF
jgi:ornithine cyclodeaminase/alanine dehydrogenase-like protein (mu-crystallin family)